MTNTRRHRRRTNHHHPQEFEPMRPSLSLQLLERLVADESEPCRYEGERCKTHDLDLPCAVREAREELGMSASPFPRVPVELPEGYDDHPHIWDRDAAEWVRLAWAPDGGWDVPGHERRPEGAQGAGGGPTPVSAAPGIIVLPSQQVIVVDGVVRRLVPGKAGTMVPGAVVSTVSDPGDPLTRLLQALLDWRESPGDPERVDALFAAIEEWKGARP